MPSSSAAIKVNDLSNAFSTDSWLGKDRVTEEPNVSLYLETAMREVSVAGNRKSNVFFLASFRRVAMKPLMSLLEDGHRILLLQYRENEDNAVWPSTVMAVSIFLLASDLRIDKAMRFSPSVIKTPLFIISPSLSACCTVVFLWNSLKATFIMR